MQHESPLRPCKGHYTTTGGRRSSERFRPQIHRNREYGGEKVRGYTALSGTRVVDFTGTFAWKTFYSPNAKEPASDITAMPITPGSPFTPSFADRPPHVYEPMLLSESLTLLVRRDAFARVATAAHLIRMRPPWLA